MFEVGKVDATRMARLHVQKEQGCGKAHLIRERKKVEMRRGVARFHIHLVANMSLYRAVRAATSAEASIGSLRTCSKPRFLYLNASSWVVNTGATVGGKGVAAQRYFSQSRCALAASAEAVYVLLDLHP
jgi:hypothetical protein